MAESVGRKVVSWLASASASTITSPLPLEWRNSSPHFSFGVPWPWQAMSGADLAELAQDIGVAPITAVMAPRSDGRTAYFAVLPDENRADVVFENVRPLADGRCGALHATRVRSPRRVVVGGLRAVILTMTSRSSPTAIVEVWMATPPGAVVVGQMVVPADQREGYGHHLDAMLASWAWL